MEHTSCIKARNSSQWCVFGMVLTVVKGSLRCQEGEGNENRSKNAIGLLMISRTLHVPRTCITLSIHFLALDIFATVGPGQTSKLFNIKKDTEISSIFWIYRGVRTCISSAWFFTSCLPSFYWVDSLFSLFSPPLSLKTTQFSVNHKTSGVK